jgi:hypothetical protein
LSSQQLGDHGASLAERLSCFGSSEFRSGLDPPSPLRFVRIHTSPTPRSPFDFDWLIVSLIPYFDFGFEKKKKKIWVVDVLGLVELGV